VVLGKHLSRFPAGAASWTRLINLSRAFWSCVRTIVGEISLFGAELAQHSGLYGFSSCLISGAGSRHELFAKSHFCRLFFRQHFSSPKFIMAVGEDRNKDWFKDWQLCGVKLFSVLGLYILSYPTLNKVITTGYFSLQTPKVAILPD